MYTLTATGIVLLSTLTFVKCLPIADKPQTLAINAEIQSKNVLNDNINRNKRSCNCCPQSSCCCSSASPSKCLTIQPPSTSCIVQPKPVSTCVQPSPVNCQVQPAPITCAVKTRLSVTATSCGSPSCCCYSSGSPSCSVGCSAAPAIYPSSCCQPQCSSCYRSIQPCYQQYGYSMLPQFSYQPFPYSCYSRLRRQSLAQYQLQATAQN
uniref:CC domain-containing protein n=1 Tax=Syphacia muris TaxID=451379 RepID=A0A0N5AHN3_9BILA